ncbi:MAG TPA: OmpA family protein [Oligoflexia bacterium]|nr:OmpA family protein [Oligoflexia bacterium]
MGSPTALAGTPYTFKNAQGMYVLGGMVNGVAGDCGTANTICSVPATDDVTAKIFDLDKEVASSKGSLSANLAIGAGPSYPETVTITGTVAGPVTLNNVTINEVIPEVLEVVDPGDCSSFTIIPAPSSCSYTPDISSATGGSIDINYTTLSSGFTLTYTGSYKQFRDDASEIIGSSLIAVNESTDVTVNADELTTPEVDSDNYRVYGVDYEKSWSLASDLGGSGLTPLDSIEITHHLVVSDFYAIENMLISDLIPDGLSYVDMSLQVTVNEGGVTTVLNEADLEAFAYYTQTVFPDGTTDLLLDLGSAMEDTVNFSFADGLLTGAASFGGGTPTTSVTLIYQVTVDEDFETVPTSGDISIDAGDIFPLGTASMDFDVVGGDAGQTITGTTYSDFTEQSNPKVASLQATTIEISHINGMAPPGGTVHVAPGDEVTYKITVSIPGGDVENLSITNYLPNPLFDEALCPTYDGAAIPANDMWSFGVNDPSLLSGDVTVTCSAANNSINFAFVDFEIVGGSSGSVEVFFTKTVSNEPFTDGLIQSNMVITEYDNSETTAQSSATGVYAFIGDAPLLEMTKTVESTDDAGASISAGNVSDIDANAVVSYLVTLENTGQEEALDVAFTDNIVAGFIAPATSGACSGVACGYNITLNAACSNSSVPDTATNVDETKVEITSMSIAAGETCEIRFDLRLRPDNIWGNSYTNEGQAVYASSLGGTQFSPIDDDSEVTIQTPSVGAVTISPSSSGTVGELVTFNVEVTFPQGQATSTRAYLREIPGDFWGTTNPADFTVTVSGGVTGTGPYCVLGGTEVCFDNNPTTSLNASSAIQAYINLGTTYNTATDLAGRTVVFSFEAQNNNATAGNKNVGGRYRYNNGSSNINVDSGTSVYTLNKPNVSMLKCADSATAALAPISLSDSLSYNIILKNTGSFVSTAHDLSGVSDLLVQGLKYSANTVNAYYCSSGASAVNAGNCPTWIPANCTAVLTDLSADVRLGETVEASPFGGDSRQSLSFPFIDPVAGDSLGVDAYFVYQIQPEVSCESVSDSDGVNSPIGSHPDDDGVVNGCPDPVLPYVTSVSNAASVTSYSSLDGVVAGEGSYGPVNITSSSLNVDHDNDGIANSDEGSGDNDGDGVPNYLDTDADDNGTDDATEGTGDADGDGTPDYLDTDDDNDGITDADEITTSMGTMIDSDGDGTPDYLDNDADGDGILDGDEGGPGTDSDGDGTPDYLDLDSDNDGIPDLLEHMFHVYDTDGNGILSPAEIVASGLDSNMDGAIGVAELPGGVFDDVDGDGTPNYLDLDADGDGISDLDESGLTVYDDNVDNFITSAEATDIDDGAGDDVSGGTNDDNSVLNFDEILDSDGDGLLNFLDRDSDNDGVYDFVENERYACDSNEDGFITSAEVTACGVFTDVDGDGLLQLDEAAVPNSDGAVPADHTSDSDPDYIDIDSDGDGVADWIEAYPTNIDTDANGSISDAEYSVANGGGDLLFSELANSEPLTNPDAIPDMYDLDSDNDTIYDMHESDASEMYPTYDTSSVVILYSNLYDSEAMPDGIPDFRDTDSDGDSYLDEDEAGDADLNTIPVAIDDPAVPDFQNFSRPELNISKCTVTGTQDPITLAGNVNYAIQIENNGDRVAYDVENLVDVLPQGLKYTAASATVFYCSTGADVYSCADDVSSDGNCTNISIASAMTEIVEASPFGGDSQQSLTFQVENASGQDQIAVNGFYKIIIPTQASCESVADNSGLDFPIGTHPDADGIVDGCTDPVMLGVASISNLISGLDYSTYDGIDPNEATYTSADSNNVALDTDHDGDGQLTGDEGIADADGDGVPNYLDTDSDDNGVSDSLDSTADTDGDGTPDYIDADDDNDGLSDSEEITISGSGTDTDGDGSGDSMDPDSDGDGFIDGEDGGSGTDTDGDGQEDSLDNDSDNDGILDMIEIGLGQHDTNMDGQLNAAEIAASGLDSNMDGAISESELPGGALPDSDGDGIPNYQDTDSDNDGISDLEDNFFGQLTPAQLATVDANANGQIEAGEQAALFALLGDGDGVLEDSDLSDTDNDGTANYLDTDSDGDGIPDLIESGRFVCDTNEDAILTVTEVLACVAATDSNMDGLLQHSEQALGDQDVDTFFNHLDIDADGDGLGDIIEGHVADIDGNADGYISPSEYQTAYNTLGNMDGVMTISELADSETLSDGIADYFDLDSDDDSILDLHESDATEMYPNYDANSVVTTYANLMDSDAVSDGIPDFRDTDSDNDGVLDSAEAGDALTNTIPIDTDMDGIPNFQDTDSDEDGLLDSDEATLMSNPLLADTDMDGCTDSCEVFGTNPPAEVSCPFIGHPSSPGTVISPISDPTDADTDDGGTNDCDEANEPTDPRNPADDPWLDEDADNDGVTNGQENVAGTNPNNPDSDTDGCTDGCEIFGTTAMCPYDDPENAAWFPGMGTVMSPVTNPLLVDSDADGCNDCLEATTLFTNPNVADTDADGANDCQEYGAGTDPNNPDSDGDGLLDGLELNTLNTNPNSNDTDMDGCLDGDEVNTYGSNPLADPDSDNDGLTDCEEDGTYGTDRNNPDTDGGGINDGLEVNTFGTDPLNANDDCPTVRDTDGDGLTDCEEIDLGLDPSNPNDATPRGSGTIGFLDWGICNSGSNPGIVLLMMIAVLMAVFRKGGKMLPKKFLSLLLIAFFLAGQNAHAINIHYLTPKILNPDGHQALSSTTLEPGKIAVGAYFTWTKSPLEFGASGDGDAIDDIVKWVFTQDLLFGVGVSDRFSFQVHAPFHVYNDVENFAQYTSSKEFNVGDITLQGLLQLQGKNWNAVGGTWGFGFVPFVTFPVGEENRFFGNKDITGGGYFVLDRWSGMKRQYFTMNLGGRYRPNVENIGALEIGSEVLGKLGYVYRFLNSEGWQVFAELSGSMSLHEPKEVNSPAELYLGLQKISKNERWKWTMGTSRAGNNGYGAPDVRLYTGISYTNKSLPKKPTPPRPKPVPTVTPTPEPTPIPKQTGMFNLKIVDQYGEKINTQVKVMSDSKVEPLFEGEISELSKTVDEGVVMVVVGDDEKPLQKVYQIKANQDNNYTIVYDQNKGEKFDLKGKIFFNSGSYTLNAEAKTILLDAYEKIQKAKINKLYVEAHTDSLGNAEKNLELSTERANAVRQYLIQLGMDPLAVSAKGMGEADPVASNTTADGRALNRRVDFFVK